MPLPSRQRAEEEAFVRAWTERDDVDGLVAVIEEAMQVRRVRLAARLVGLLPDDVDDPDDLLGAARRAARLVLLDTTDTPPGWSALDEAWDALRSQRMHRIKRRMRDALEGRTTRRGRLDKGRRRR